MPPGNDRAAIGGMGLALLVIVVIVVGGAVGISYPKAGQGAVVTRTIAPTTSASTSSASTPSASSTTTVTTSSAVSSVATTSQLTASAPLFNFVLSSFPQRILLSPGANLTYATLSVIPLPSSHQVAGLPLEVGDELVVLNASVPSGLHLRFFGSNLLNTMYREVSLSGQEDLTLNLAADKSIAPGDYTITIQAASGNYAAKVSFTVRVTQHLVIAYLNAFGPSSLTVKAGDTVYWLNLGGNGGPENTYDITFNSLKVQSPQLNGNLFESFSYTFTTPGTYTYYCSLVTDMTGTITVTS